MVPVPPSAFLDANVLFSRTLRDWLCRTSLVGEAFGETPYRVRWSEDVLVEWLYHRRLKNQDVSDVALGGQRRRMEASFPLAMVEGYDPASVPSTPDTKDRHVLAAAIHAEVDWLVTDDRLGFPEECVQGRLEVVTADEFLSLMLGRHPDVLLHSLEDQLTYWARRDPPRDCEEILEALERAGAQSFAAAMRASVSCEELSSNTPRVTASEGA